AACRSAPEVTNRWLPDRRNRRTVGVRDTHSLDRSATGGLSDVTVGTTTSTAGWGGVDASSWMNDVTGAQGAGITTNAPLSYTSDPNPSASSRIAGAQGGASYVPGTVGTVDTGTSNVPQFGFTLPSANTQAQAGATGTQTGTAAVPATTGGGAAPAVKPVT